MTAIALLVLALVSGSGSGDKRLTLEQTERIAAEKVDFTRDATDWEWADDGVHLTNGELWMDPHSGETRDAVEPDVDPHLQALIDHRPQDMPEPNESPEDGDGKAGKPPGRVLETSPDGTAALLRWKDALWFHRDGETPRWLLEADDGELFDLSDDGSGVGFVHANDLGWIETATGKTTFLTTDGNDELFFGKLDWVYQEEIYGRGQFKGFWWSPTSDRIAFLKLDESPVHSFTVVDHLHPDGSKRVAPEVTNYPKAGDPNPIVELCVTTLGGETTKVDLSKYDGQEFLIVRVGWNPDGTKVIYQVQDRIQTWLDLCEADPATGASRVLIHEASQAWTNVLGEPRWLDDGTFLWFSERNGHKHLYRYRADGTLVGAITAGDWDVLSLVELDEEAGRVWFTSNRDGAVNQTGWVVGLDGSEPRRVTSASGWHAISVGDEGLVLDEHSSLTELPGATLYDADGEVLRDLSSDEPTDLDDYATSTWELVEIPNRDGFVMDGALLKPVDFDPERVYPVWLPTYSGPDAPTVRNRWNASKWYQFLAQQGYVVLQVNVRSASRKGHEHIATCYKRLGVGELRDLEDAVDWLVAHPWADAERVGITGWSYGGFMTAYALTHSDKFALGIAGAGVYEWSLYDTVYTERYMQTPELNPEGYAETSVLNSAEDLSGHLVLLHGTMDDNVHLQNTIQLVWELQKADQPFELMLYPESRHGVRDKDLTWHKRQLEWRTIDEVLGGEPPPPRQ